MGRAKKPNRSTPAQQSMAARIRAKLKNPSGPKGSASREERQWLAKYELEHPYRNGTKLRAAKELGVDVQPTTYEPMPSSPAPSSPAPASTSASTSADEAPPAAEPKRFTVDFGEPVPSEIVKRERDDHDSASCPFGDKCPHCRDGVPKRNHVLGKCGTTGKVVYEPMDEKGARFFAGFILNTMALGGRLLRPDHALIEPEDEDYEDMSKGVQMVVDRRMPQLTVINDLLALGFAVSAFGRRALFDPPPAPQQPRSQQRKAG